MRIILVVIYSLLVFSSCKEQNKTAAQEFVVYLVRHAEKDTATPTNDPELTTCGVLRAKNLVTLLKDVDLDKVYSTNYKRTQNTAKPTAAAKNTTIISYDPKALNTIAVQVLKEKKNALIVGHSNTTSVLAGMLVGEELEVFDEHIYNRVYKVMINDKEKTLEVLEPTFECRE